MIGRLGVIALVALSPAPTALAEGSPAVAEAAVEGGLLTLDVRGAPLAEVVRAIGERAGFRVVLTGDLDAPVTWAFAAVPLVEGLRRLLGDTSWAMVHHSSQLRAEPGGVAELHVVGADDGTGKLVVGRALPGAMGQRVYKGPGTVIASIGLEERLRDVRRLADRPNAGDVERLAELLADDGDPVVRRIAAIGLGKVRDDRAREALAVGLMDEDATVRGRAVRGLSELDDERAVELLGTALAGDPDPDVRRLAARALAGMTVEGALAALHAGQGDPDRRVREAAVVGIGRW